MKRAINTPSRIKTSFNTRAIDACAPGPLRYSPGVAIECYVAILAGIASLLLKGRPSNVADLVVAVYIDAVKRMGGRWFGADGEKKLVEVDKSKLNAATAVVFIVNVQAPAPCRVVGNLFWRAFCVICTLAGYFPQTFVGLCRIGKFGGPLVAGQRPSAFRQEALKMYGKEQCFIG